MLSGVAPAQDSPVDSEGRVCRDIPCRNCGYDLRSLLVAGVCPECGRPVLPSLYGDELRYASPAWVRRLARGAELIVIALVVLVAEAIAAFALSIALAATMDPTAPPPGGLAFERSLRVAAAGVNAVLIVLAVIGLLFLTARDPTPREAREGLTARRVIRVCVWVLPIQVLIWLLASVPPVRSGLTTFAGAPGGLVRGVGALLLAGSAVTFLVAWVILPLALLRHIIALMRRVPCPALVLYAQIEFWGGLAVGALTVVATACLMYFMWISIGPALAAMPATTPGAGVTTLPTSGSGSVWNYSVVVDATSPGGGVTIAATAPAAGGAPGTTGDPSIAGSGATPPASMATTVMAAPVMPAFGARFFVFSALTGLSGCVGFMLIVAGFVLLILVQRALAHAAREAAQSAAAPPPAFVGLPPAPAQPL